MAATVRKSRNEIPTIDVNLVTIEKDGDEFGFDTSNQIEVEPQLEESDAVVLNIKGRIKAQKPRRATLSSNEITLHDNVFNPELVKILQGGTIEYQPGTTKVISYTPPLAGENINPEPFTLNVYTAQYDAAGLIVQYEKTSYPNCQGQPVAFSSEDDAFRAPEYTITSAPKEGEPPYKISYVDELPTLIDPLPVMDADNDGKPDQAPIGGGPAAMNDNTDLGDGITAAQLGTFSMVGDKFFGLANDMGDKLSSHYQNDEKKQSGYYAPMKWDLEDNTKVQWRTHNTIDGWTEFGGGDADGQLVVWAGNNETGMVLDKVEWKNTDEPDVVHTIDVDIRQAVPAVLD